MGSDLKSSLQMMDGSTWFVTYLFPKKKEKKKQREVTYKVILLSETNKCHPKPYVVFEETFLHEVLLLREFPRNRQNSYLA